jgi:SWI/SNF-related matrix-associated actin-dependent regulator of chromatin subfamily A3
VRCRHIFIGGQDDQSLAIEGQLSGEKGSFDCPIMLKVYGTSDPTSKAALEARIKEDKLPIKGKREANVQAKKVTDTVEYGRKRLGMKGSQSGMGISQAEEQSLGDLIQQAEVFRPRAIEDIAQQWASPEEQLEAMPKAEQPKAMKAMLLPYQLQVRIHIFAM